MAINVGSEVLISKYDLEGGGITVDMSIPEDMEALAKELLNLKGQEGFVRARLDRIWFLEELMRLEEAGRDIFPNLKPLERAIAFNNLQKGSDEIQNLQARMQAESPSGEILRDMLRKSFLHLFKTPNTPAE